MSGNGYVIDNWGLLVALLMVAVAALVSELMCISIGKTLMWSAIRALVQLCVMGVIIGYVIRSNNPWLVFGVIAVMLVAAKGRRVADPYKVTENLFITARVL